MWTESISKLYTDIKKENIWRLWTDVNNWAKWHEDLDYCKLEGAFEVGNHFILKPKGTGPVKIILTEIEEGIRFTNCTKFFGAKMYVTHIIEETPEGLLLTNKLVVTGPLAWLWLRLVAKNVAATAPKNIEALVALARDRHA